MLFNGEAVSRKPVRTSGGSGISRSPFDRDVGTDDATTDALGYVLFQHMIKSG